MRFASIGGFYPKLGDLAATATKQTSPGLQQNGQSPMYDCSGTDRSWVNSMVSQQ
jgi:hypothetical protein